MTLCYNFNYMQNNFRPKKRVARDSVDGILPSPQQHLHTPRYYRGSIQPNSPQAPTVSRRRPHQDLQASIPKEVAEAEQPKLGDFAAPATVGVPTFQKPPKKSGRNRKDKKEKGEKKHRMAWAWRNRSRKYKVFIIAFVLLLIAAGAGGLRLRNFFNSVFAKKVGNSSSSALNKNVSADQLNTEGDGRLNILLLGRGGDENEAPDLTDTLIVASIDLQNQSTSLLSIPRDTWVSVGNENMKINAAYSTAKMKATYQGKSAADAETAGIRQAIDSVRSVSGVPIHKYVLADYKAFRDIVNALGGVDITVPVAINDYFAGWKFAAGQQHMNGDRALQYARTRHGNARGDFDRSEHQRQLLVAMRDKAGSTGIIANPVKLNSLANAVQKNIRTDLTVDEAKSLYDKTKTMADASIQSLDLAKPDGPLVTTGNVSGQSIVRPVAGLTDFSKIRAYARTNMIDPYLKKEAPKVAVYNASGRAGAATFVGDVLAGYGYSVLTKDTSATTQPQTLVVKITKDDKPFTNRFLSVRFNTSITHDVPNGVVPAAAATTAPTTAGQATTTPPQPDYIIILGLNYAQGSGPTW